MTIFGYSVDVTPPRVDIDSVLLTDLAGVGRPVEPGNRYVACMEDLANPTGTEPDTNDYCILVPSDTGADLHFLGGLSAYIDVNTAAWDAGQVRFTSPEGSWLTGSDHVWVGRIVQPDVPRVETPEPAAWMLLALGLLFWGVWLAVWKWRK